MGVAGHNTRLIPGVLEEGKARILDELITITSTTISTASACSHHRATGLKARIAQESTHLRRSRSLGRGRTLGGFRPHPGEGLTASLPYPMGSMGACHLHLDPEVSQPLLAPGAATLDSLLKPVRAAYGSWHKCRRRLAPGSRLPHRGENLC